MDYAMLDPGIRDAVRRVRDAGFVTTDSGDGRSKPAGERTFDVPHIACPTGVDTLAADADRLQAVLGPGWYVEASYSTASRSVIMLAFAGDPTLAEQPGPLALDAATFLELLLSDCDSGAHAWSTCRRCLAMADLQDRGRLPRRFLKCAIGRLRSDRAPAAPPGAAGLAARHARPGVFDDTPGSQPDHEIELSLDKDQLALLSAIVRDYRLKTMPGYAVNKPLFDVIQEGFDRMLLQEIRRVRLLVARHPPDRSVVGLDLLVGQLAMEPVLGTKPLLPEPRYSQDVACVAHLIDTLRARLRAADTASQGQQDDALRQARSEVRHLSVELTEARRRIDLARRLNGTPPWDANIRFVMDTALKGEQPAMDWASAPLSDRYVGGGSMAAAACVSAPAVVRAQIDEIGRLLMGYAMACTESGTAPDENVRAATVLLSGIEVA